MDIKTLVKMELMEGLMDLHALSGVPIADMINEAVKDYLEKLQLESRWMRLNKNRSRVSV